MVHTASRGAAAGAPGRTLAAAVARAARRTLATASARAPGRTLAVAAVAALVLALPAAALAGTVTKRDGRGLKPGAARGLDAGERRALDIASVRATGLEGVGLLVSVTFEGDVERRIGRGDLRDAVVALVLRPRSRGKRAAILATRGAGPLGVTLRGTASRRSFVTRDGRRLDFLVIGPGLSAVERVDVLALARLGGSRGAGASRLRLADVVKPLSRRLRRRILGATPADEVKAPSPKATRDCRSVRDSLTYYRRHARGLADELARRITELREIPEGHPDRSNAEGRVQITREFLDRAVDEVNRLRKLEAELCKEAFRESTFATWRHGTGRTNVCIFITGTPGQTGFVTMTGPSGGGARDFRLDENGRGLLTFTITVAGEYEYAVNFRQPDGSVRAQAGDVTVMRPPTNGPPPPEGSIVSRCPPP